MMTIGQFSRSGPSANSADQARVDGPRASWVGRANIGDRGLSRRTGRGVGPGGGGGTQSGKGYRLQGRIQDFGKGGGGLGNC